MYGANVSGRNDWNDFSIHLHQEKTHSFTAYAISILNNDRLLFKLTNYQSNERSTVLHCVRSYIMLKASPNHQANLSHVTLNKVQSATIDSRGTMSSFVLWFCSAVVAHVTDGATFDASIKSARPVGLPKCQVRC